MAPRDDVGQVCLVGLAVETLVHADAAQLGKARAGGVDERDRHFVVGDLLAGGEALGMPARHRATPAPAAVAHRRPRRELLPLAELGRAAAISVIDYTATDRDAWGQAPWMPQPARRCSTGQLLHLLDCGRRLSRIRVSRTMLQPLRFLVRIYPLLSGPPQPVLVVDLDGTLLRSDALLECFWNACGNNWRVLFGAVAALTEGRAALKRHLAQCAALDAATLPYDSVVLAYVKDWRAKGGRTALVTASDAGIARAIAEHLGVFDEVYGSDGVHNLKGSAKADFLEQRFGAAGFAYMGDAVADLPVWQKSHAAITVNAPDHLRQRVASAGGDVEHLRTASRTLLPYAKAIRPHQWAKNVLVFVPMLTAHQLALPTFLQSTLAFVAFSLVASSVYVLNDLLDLSADRAHPRKRNRPFAAGSIPIAQGTWMTGGLLLAGIALAAPLGWHFLLVMVGYYLATMAYSLHLKRRAVVDICVLAVLYTIRILAGGAATGIPISVWLLAFSIFFFFALAAVKRQGELVDNLGRNTRKVSGRGYHVEDAALVSQMAIASGYVAVLIMALYLDSPAVVGLYSEPAALWGICLVLLYWISRMVMVAHRGAMHDDPIVYAVKDRVSQVCGLLILGFALAGVLL
jgi:4-hydroxybenzoate polyprenyltransferase/phosphoserine phosphatase